MRKSQAMARITRATALMRFRRGKHICNIANPPTRRDLIKTIFGDRVCSRSFEGQAAEIFIRCSALNYLTRLGIPDSYAA
jgi:hypothetical protein